MKSQIVGNVGLYQVCAELSRLGFNVMPTSRNAKGIDIVGYDEHGKAFTVQVKTLTKRNAIPLTSNGSHLMADYFIVVVLEGKYRNMYIWTREEMRNAEISVFTGKDGKKQHWFESKVWTKDLISVNAWDKVVP
jgi:hypothetical protein